MALLFLFCSFSPCYPQFLGITFWWSLHVSDTLAEDRKEMAALEELLKDAPVVVKTNGVPYIRIVEGTETSDLKNENSHVVDGYYAKVWHKQ